MKYPVGTKIECNGCSGTVVENFKLAGDICIEWDVGMKSSYDEEWLNDNVKIIY